MSQFKYVDYEEKEDFSDVHNSFKVYRERNDDQSFASDFVSDVMLPAHMYNGKGSCGQIRMKGCIDKHKDGKARAIKTKMSCNTKGCRICWVSSVDREARSITNRLMTFCNLKKNKKIYLKQNRSRILLHIAVSPPPEVWGTYATKKGRMILRNKASAILKRLGIDGDVMIDHPYRFTDGLKSAYLSPHFHCVATGWMDGNEVSKISKETGYNVIGISNMESWDDTFHVVRYLLSHSAVFLKEEGKRSSEHSVRYHGELQNRFFKVDDVLKYSKSGYGDLESILNGRSFLTKNTKDGVKVVGSLNSVHYTDTFIKNSIKDSESSYFVSYTMDDLENKLKSYITPVGTDIEDNPALSQSASSKNEPSSLHFLQMRFDYDIFSNHTLQSVYVNVIFDYSLDELCPACSLKMETLAPPNVMITDEIEKKIKDVVVSLQDDVVLSFDNNGSFDYLRNVIHNNVGLPYFKDNGSINYDTGVYEKPENIEDLNPTLYWGIIKNTRIQKARYVFKLEHGRTPTKEELSDVIDVMRKNRHTENESLYDY